MAILQQKKPDHSSRTTNVDTTRDFEACVSLAVGLVAVTIATFFSSGFRSDRGDSDSTRVCEILPMQGFPSHPIILFLPWEQPYRSVPFRNQLGRGSKTMFLNVERKTHRNDRRKKIDGWMHGLNRKSKRFSYKSSRTRTH